MISEQQLRQRIRLLVARVGKQQEFAEAIGVHPGTLSAFMSGDRPPSKGLLDALGYERVKNEPRYTKKEISTHRIFGAPRIRFIEGC